MEMQKTELGQAQVAEALLRMKKLILHENVIHEFKSEGKINRSEFGGILYWLDEKENGMVKEWEEETGNMVYHVIKNHTDLGVLYSFLYVSKYTEEWESDMADLEEGYAFVYVWVEDDPIFYEYGTIGIKPSIGGVRRTA